MSSPRWTRNLLSVALALLALSPLGWLWWRLAHEGGRRALSGEAPADNEPTARAFAVSVARLRFKEGLTEALLADRLSLREAAARLRDYHAGEPRLEGVRSGRDLVAKFPGQSEEERCARCLGVWARRRADAFPSEAAERGARRVERELADSYGRAPPARAGGSANDGSRTAE